MPQREHHNIQGDSSSEPSGVITSFDELTKGLATGAVSRRKALRWMGGALLGAALASVPGVAWANDCRRLGRECRRDSQCCSKNCIRRGDDKVCGCPQGQTRCNDRCVNRQINERHCGSCFNRCAEEQECVGGVCQCPSGNTECGGACVSDSCPEGQFFNPETCACEEGRFGCCLCTDPVDTEAPPSACSSPSDPNVITSEEECCAICSGAVFGPYTQCNFVTGPTPLTCAGIPGPVGIECRPI